MPLCLRYTYHHKRQRPDRHVLRYPGNQLHLIVLPFFVLKLQMQKQYLSPVHCNVPVQWCHHTTLRMDDLIGPSQLMILAYFYHNLERLLIHHNIVHHKPFQYYLQLHRDSLMSNASRVSHCSYHHSHQLYERLNPLNHFPKYSFLLQQLNHSSAYYKCCHHNPYSPHLPALYVNQHPLIQYHKT